MAASPAFAAWRRMAAIPARRAAAATPIPTSFPMRRTQLPTGRSWSPPPASGSAAGRTSLDDAATFIGSSLGELMNRKDALAKQLATVEKQIAALLDEEEELRVGLC